MVTFAELQPHVFFGYELSESGLLADAVMYHVQEELMKLSTVLTRHGLVAFGSNRTRNSNDAASCRRS